MKKQLSLSELRKLVSSVIREVMEAEQEDPAKAKTQHAPPTYPQAVAKTQPAPAAAPERQTIGARDLNKVMQKMERPTVPAAASKQHRAADQQLAAQGANSSGQPLNPRGLSNNIPMSKDPRLGRVEKILQQQGHQADSAALRKWMSDMDPTNKFMKTDQDLANEFLTSLSQNKTG